MNYHRNTDQDAASEYLPRPGESTGNGNGNGNGHGKIFTLKPAMDPDTLAILEARDHALRDERLIGAMRAFFCLILDRALDPEYYRPHPRGIVTLSDTVLANDLGVCNRTIFRWKKAIEECGDYFWLSRQFRTNMWPITTYHITCLHPPRRGKTDRDGTYGAGGVGRSLPENFPLGARRPGQPGLPLPGSRQTRKAPKNSQVPGIAGLTGKACPVSPDTDVGSDPTRMSGQTRHGLRARPDTDVGSDPTRMSGETRHGCRVRPEADCQHIERETGEKRVLETETVCGPPPSPRPAHTTQLPSFEPLDLRMAPRLRPQWGEKSIERCTARISALEQSREPLHNRKEVIAAYRQRIKDVKKWMVGEQ